MKEKEIDRTKRNFPMKAHSCLTLLDQRNVGLYVLKRI